MQGFLIIILCICVIKNYIVVLTVKNRMSVYKRWEVDVWGLMLTAAPEGIWCNNKNKLLRFFFKLYKLRNQYREFFKRRYVYRIDKHYIFPRRKKWNERFVSVRLTRLYFLTLKDFHFRQMFRKAGKLSGNTEVNYCRLLEGRIVSIFYRMNYLSNIFTIMRFVRGGVILVNFKHVFHFNYLVPIGAFISIRRKYRKLLNLKLLFRLKRKAILFNIPSFMFMSYCFHFCYLLRYPRKDDLVYPFDLDIQRLTGYF